MGDLTAEAGSAARVAREEGTRHLLAGRVAEALVQLRRAVTLAPDDRDARFNLAVALRSHGDRDGALRHGRAAVSLDPSFANAHALLGTLLHLTGDLEGATERYARAVALAPTHRAARYYLGSALRAAGRSQEALVHLSMALEPGPGALPPLVRERVRGVLYDTSTRAARARPVGDVGVDLCSIALVTEVLDVATSSDTDQVPAELLDARETPPRPARQPTVPTGAGSAMELTIGEAAARLARARRVVALTGAGISSSSGLRTRKDLWRQYSRDDAVSVWRFRDDPGGLWAVVRDFLGEVDHEPNAAHHALAALPGLCAILTQNVDDLHQGAERIAARRDRREPPPIVELHGSLEATRCHECDAPGARSHGYVRGPGPLPPPCPRCGGPIRPDVVLFGEQVDRVRLAEASAWATRCDAMLVVGCAMDVAPASELPRLAAGRGAFVLEVKRNPSRITTALGGGFVRGAAEDVLPAIVAERLRLHTSNPPPSQEPARS